MVNLGLLATKTEPYWAALGGLLLTLFSEKPLFLRGNSRGPFDTDPN